MADTAYERVLCVKNEVLVYKIPPRQSNRGYRAADWKLDSPDWTGRLRVVSKEKDLFIKIEDKTSGELFAQCPVDAHPGIAVEAVSDSSRYFVLRIQDGSGRSASIGIGFHDRSDSFDLNVSLQDHFKALRLEENAAKETQAFEQGPKLDLGFKEGQTVTLNLGMKKDGKAKPKPAKTGNIGFLPPPPRAGAGAGKIPGPPAAAPSGDVPAPQAPPDPSSSSSSSNVQNVDLLFDLGSSSTPAPTPTPTLAPATATTTTDSTANNQNPPDLWGDFTGAAGSQSAPSSSSVSNNWMQF